jgi:hypothetical protein
MRVSLAAAQKLLGDVPAIAQLLDAAHGPCAATRQRPAER